jgi:hypothetical protein
LCKVLWRRLPHGLVNNKLRLPSHSPNCFLACLSRTCLSDNRRRHERGEAERETVCEVCGAEFTASRADAKTCSATCRQRLHRQRV